MKELRGHGRSRTTRGDAAIPKKRERRVDTVSQMLESRSEE